MSNGETTWFASICVVFLVLFHVSWPPRLLFFVDYVGCFLSGPSGWLRPRWDKEFPSAKPPKSHLVVRAVANLPV